MSLSIFPYLELMRLGNPVGSLLTYFPHLFGSLLATRAYQSVTVKEFIFTNVILFVASVLLHAAGCSWNDIIDANIDKKVARTRMRPIPRGAISLNRAYMFTVAETLIWLWFVSLLSHTAVVWSLPVIPATVLYPWMKRITMFPSVFLGMIISWGIHVGVASIDQKKVIPGSLTSNNHLYVALFYLFLAYSIQVCVLDMIYTHQDVLDDLKIGVLSMAVRFRINPKTVMAAMISVQLTLLYLTGTAAGLGLVYSTAACGGVAMINTWMILAVDLASPADCWWWFQRGAVMVGTIISAGICAEIYVNPG